MEIRSEPSIRGFLSRTPEQKSKPGEVFLLVAQIGQKFRRREEDGTFTLVGSAYIDLIMIGDKAEEAFRQSLLGSQGSLGVFFSNGLVGSIMTLGLIALFWPLISSGWARLQGRTAKATT